jgi:hypothetical protein
MRRQAAYAKGFQGNSSYGFVRILENQRGACKGFLSFSNKFSQALKY